MKSSREKGLRIQDSVTLPDICKPGNHAHTYACTEGKKEKRKKPTK
jgi:hypothetical protein